jgi:hypothetical protein
MKRAFEVTVTALLLSSATFAQTPAEQVFCGPSPKTSPAQVCQSFATYPNNQSLENVEIRGWVVASGEPQPDGVDDNTEGEMEFSVMLDVNWTPTPGITAINTLQQIGSWLTPYNIMTWGLKNPVYQAGTSGSPGDALPEGTFVVPQTKWSELGKGKWGGVGSAVIHIEVDGWAAGRGCLTLPLSPDGWPFHDAYAESTNPAQSCSNSHYDLDMNGNVIWVPATFWDDIGRTAPAGWTYTTPDADQPAFRIYWPFTPPSISNGDYVRLVGTLFRDSYHGPSTTFYPPRGYGELGDEQSCWQGDDDYTDNGGHLEMHPVSLIQHATPPSAANVHRIGAYEICDKWNDLVNLQDSFAMPTPAPHALSFVHVNEFVRGDFTNWTSLRPDSSATRYYVSPGGVVNIMVQSQDGNPPAKFMGLYEAYWDCTPYCTDMCAAADNGCGQPCGHDQCETNFACAPGSTGSCVRVCTPNCSTSCGGTSDGCGATCPTINCGGSLTCNAGSCGCPAGTIDCGGTCVNPNTDAHNCGGCGWACSLPDNRCVAGSCTCGAGLQVCCGGDICASKCPKQCP